MANKNTTVSIFKILVLIVCIILGILSLWPFLIMIVNSTRSTNQIQQHAVSLIPSKYFFNNIKVLNNGTFNAATGFVNSLIVSVGVTVLTLYFSTLTAYGLVMYEWKLKKAFFSFIMAVMMIPATLTVIGFYQMIYKVGLVNKLFVLILPAIQSPAMVFFMRQYMKPSVSPSLVESARIDGSKEFFTFNAIVLPIMKPAIATQAIFTFVTSWNNLFIPSVVLTQKEHFTLPIMISQLNGDIYKREHGSIYVALTLTALPLIIVYFFLSKYIVAGVAMGSVKG